jgi:hypothetical protein
MLLGALVLFLSPVSPLPFYLMTLWLDSAMAVGLLWFAVIVFSVDERLASRRRTWPLLAAGLALAVWLGLVRHNGIALVPVFCLFFWFAARRLGRGRVALVAIAPLVAVAAVNASMARALRVERTHHVNSVLALELVGAAALDRSVLDDLPYTRGYIDPITFPSNYIFGEVRSVMSESESAVRRGFVKTRHDPLLWQDYWSLVTRHPLVLARVKLNAFHGMLGLGTTDYWFQGRTIPNVYGFTLNARFKRVRDRWLSLAWGVSIHPPRWISGVHAVWMVAGAAMLWRGCRRRRIADVIVPLVALAYYATYLVAATGHDFRLMYPATLLVQVLAAGWLIARVTAWSAPGMKRTP